MIPDHATMLALLAAQPTSNFDPIPLYALIAIVVYFLPSFMATIHKKKNASAIFTLNFMLGWTVLGWIVALVWAETKD